LGGHNGSCYVPANLDTKGCCSDGKHCWTGVDTSKCVYCYGGTHTQGNAFVCDEAQKNCVPVNPTPARP
jgi:hypothetical protein